jgi:hypothetical protein
VSYLEDERVWVDYLKNINKTINGSAILNQTCEDTIKAMNLIDAKLLNAVLKQWGRRKLPNDQIFVSIYFKRNISYLQSSYALASIGFIDPSLNLSRTVFETLLREYLYIVDPKEAEEYFQVNGTKNEEAYYSQKGVGYMRKKLYSEEMNTKLKMFYGVLCTYSHPDIRGAGLGYPNYSLTLINDNFKTILSLMYGNIQVLAECFSSFLDAELIEIVKTTLENIAFDTKHIPLFEPDNQPYASNLRFKKGNFETLL